MAQPEKQDVAELPRPAGGLIGGEDAEGLEPAGLVREETGDDLGTTDLAKGVEEPCDGVVDGDWGVESGGGGRTEGGVGGRGRGGRREAGEEDVGQRGKIRLQMGIQQLRRLLEGLDLE